MSVPKGKRNEASTEFLRTARDIEELFLSLRINKPKRYAFFFDRLLDLSWSLLNEVKQGNSWYPENQFEKKKRIAHFKEAAGLCQALVSQVEVIKHKFGNDGVSTGEIKQIAELLEYEIKLLKGVIASDKKRYAGLPE